TEKTTAMAPRTVVPNRVFLPASFEIHFQKGRFMPVPNSMQDYLRMFAGELGERILQSFPALHNAHDPVSPLLATLLRKSFLAERSPRWVSPRSGKRTAVPP